MTNAAISNARAAAISARKNLAIHANDWISVPDFSSFGFGTGSRALNYLSVPGHPGTIP